MRFTTRIPLVVVAMAIATFPGIEAAGTGSVRGTIVTEGGAVASGTEVTLVELKRRTKSDASGTFVFDDVPPGRYLLEVISPRFGTAVATVFVHDGKQATVALRVDLTVHHEDIFVSAGVSPQSVADVAQSVAVIDDRELTTKAEPTLGETLSEEPGVAASSYSPGASRPIIRGLGGDRIRILQDGIGVGDASNVSPDHAVSYDPFSAERIEVVRGAATLLYGSNAVGGVVNVLDGRIPDHRTSEPLEGDVLLRYGSNSDSMTGGLTVGGTAGMFGWHADYSKTEADDYEAGGSFGVKPNSDVEIENSAVGASWLGATAYFGAAYNEYDTNYGSAVEEAVRIDMKQKRWDVLGGVTAPFGPFRSLKARLGGTDYEHVELEGGAVGTTFLNDGVEGRVELAHQQAGPWIGSFGVQGWTRDFEAIGDEAFLEPTKSTGSAIFAFEEVGRGTAKGQFGLRFENQSLESSDPTLRDRNFNAPSASAGLVIKPGDDYSVAGTLSYSSRVPTTEELYANGPHIATGTFEVGDSNLSLEKGLGLDLAFRKLTGRVNGELNFFYTRFHDFVYELDTGTTIEIEPGEFLPLVQFTQSQATFFGGEAHVDFELFHVEPHHLDLELRIDYVHAQLDDLDQPVPLQPPLRAAFGLKYQGRALWAFVEAFRAEEQDRFGPADASTPGYTLLNAAVGYRFVAAEMVHDFILRGTNLTDELAYASTSRYRFDVPLPGFDVTLAYRVGF